MSRSPHRVRLSAELNAIINAVSSNTSAAHRALLLLGAYTAGYDLQQCELDIGKLLGEAALDEPVKSRLVAVYTACRTGVAQAQGSETMRPCRLE
jgi:hypothetical protein